ncbi:MULTISPECIES: acyltransferase family protein [unclassified Bacillus cereus group]|uniref:acyltransferase family protein n=1 Tax=unclassified Bacillus cereus group TaxID=2750818 RepID=UPI00339471DE
MGIVDSRRDKKIDILRFIAITCIILAHSAPPGAIFQLRNFDVTLMVLLMGTSFYLSNTGKEIKYTSYLKKRFNRLVIPTWEFLTIFFVLFLIISLIMNVDYYFSLDDIIGSYTMFSGIGYVWIMKVFFIVAMISPFLLSFSEKVKDNKMYLLSLAIGYGIYTLFLLINHNFSGFGQKIFEEYFIQGIGYGLIAAIGIRLKKLTKKELVCACLFFLVVFASLMAWHHFDSTQAFKYPPTMYYFSYGLFASIFLYLILDFKFVNKIFDNRFVYFISKTSLWLYFWHIIPIYLIKIFGDSLPLVSGNFVTRFIFLFVIALILTVLQEKIKSSRKGTRQKQMKRVA